MNDHFLSTFKKEPSEAFSRALYQHLSVIEEKKRPATISFAFAGLMLLLSMMIILLVFPTARVYAQELIHKLGNLILSNEPTYAEQFETKIANEAIQNTVEKGPAISWQPPQLLSITEASQKAGFAIVEINRLPADYNLVVRDVWLPDNDNRFISVITTYQSQKSTLVLGQCSYEPNAPSKTLPVGEVGIKEVLVMGEKGYWVERLRLSTYVNEKNEVEPMYANLLVWEMDGFEFTLQSTPGLSLNTMLTYAESLSTSNPQ
jgi:hypothetical protein